MLQKCPWEGSGHSYDLGLSSCQHVLSSPPQQTDRACGPSPSMNHNPTTEQDFSLSQARSIARRRYSQCSSVPASSASLRAAGPLEKSIDFHFPASLCLRRRKRKNVALSHSKKLEIHAPIPTSWPYFTRNLLSFCNSQRELLYIFVDWQKRFCDRRK